MNDNDNNNTNNHNTNNRSIMSNHQQRPRPRPPSQNTKQRTETTLELVVDDNNINNNSWKVKAENAMVENERLQAELATAITANATNADNAAAELAVANRRINELELELESDDENHFNNGVIVIIDEVEVVEPPPPHLPPPPPNFGNIEEKFPGFLLLMLKYISDRTVWDSVASSNKKIYEISKGKEYQPPWPRNFLLKSNIKYEQDEQDEFCLGMYQDPVWSPDGTQIACIDVYSEESSGIVIFDQRHGRLRLRLRRDDDEDLNVENGNDEIHWWAHDYDISTIVPVLKFSPDGKFLISVSISDRFVRIWDYNSTDGYGYYQQLQEWDIVHELEQLHYEDAFYTESFDISPCCKYVALLFYGMVLLKDIHDNGKTIKSILLPENEEGNEILFSNKDDKDGHHSIFIRIHSWDGKNQTQSIKIWRPFKYFNFIEDDRVGTILKSIQTGYFKDGSNFCLSSDRPMIAICTNVKGCTDGGIQQRGEEQECSDYKVMLYSYNTEIESTENILALERTFYSSSGTILFTPDDKYIVYNNKYGSAFMEISTGRDITENMKNSFKSSDETFSFSPVGISTGRDITEIMKNSFKSSDETFSFSPVGNRLIVWDNPNRAYRIASYWESKSP